MMKKILFLLVSFLPFFAAAQKDSLQSGVFNWKVPVKQNKGIDQSVLFEGRVHDMEWLQMSAGRLAGIGDKVPVNVPVNEEQLIIIRTGKLSFTLGDSVYTVGSGSVALFIPGEQLFIQNPDSKPCEFYLMRYKSKKPVDIERGKQAGGSIVINWDTVAYKPHDKGGRRNIFDRPTAMTGRFEMHVTTLNKGFKSHDPHTHAPEEIILVTEGLTSMQIRDKFFAGKPGSIHYVGSMVAHAISNTGSQPCTYFAFQFE